MFIEVAFGLERLVTNVTRVGPLASVHTYVFLEYTWFSPCSSAVLADMFARFEGVFSLTLPRHVQRLHSTCIKNKLDQS